MFARLAAIVTSLALLAGCAAAPTNSPGEWPRHTLRAEQITVLNPLPARRVDTSALLLLDRDQLLTVNNLRPELFTVPARTTEAEVPLTPASLFTKAQLAPLAARREFPWDLEGLARDEAGRFYACDEAHRWVIRLDPASNTVERLDLDWSPVTQFFSGAERNASFEGIAVGGGKLYLANERNAPLILTVDLRTLRVTDWFQPQPKKPSLLGTHYSDLCWFDGKLWILCRQHRVVLAMNPATKAILAEYDYEAVEDSLGYRKNLPVGLMEGLAVDHDHLWLLTDNNGFARRGSADDLRPTLVRCPRPERR